MALPKQVRQQIADAKRIEGELKAAQEAAPAAPADPTPPTPTPEPQAAAPAPAATPAPAPAPAAPKPDAQYAELLQQHRSLQGIHRGMVRTNNELQSQVQTLQASVQTLTTEVEQLRQRPAQPQTTSSVITDAEVAEFGPDLISVIERKAQQVAAPLNTKLAETTAELEQVKKRNLQLEQSFGEMQHVQQENAQDKFTADLTRLVPNLNALNYDQKFLSWLTQVDPLDARRRTLQQRLDEAVELGDAEAAAGFFRTYLSIVARAAPPAPKTDLSSQAQPVSRPAPDAPPAPAGKRWTQQGISEFYADVARGRFSPADKARIEREIFTAQKENRIAA